MTDSPLSDALGAEAPGETDVKASPDPSTGAEDVSAGSESSAGPQGVEKKSMLDAVKAAVKTEKSPGSEKSEETNANDQADKEAKEKDGEKPDDISEEELSAMTPNAQRRIRELNDRMKAAEAETEAVKGKAENFDQVVGFMQKSNLTSDDVNNGFEIMAAIKNDPQRALEMLTPVIRSLMDMTGNVMPQDLKERVEAGEISEADAMELARSRAGAKLSKEREEAQAEQRKREEAQRARQTQTQTALTSAEAWSAEKRKVDPDWDKKHPKVAEKIELRVHRDGMPKSETEMRQWLDDALKQVNDEIKAFLPTPKPNTPKNPQGASERTTGAPQNMLEVVQQAVNG